MKWGKRAMEAWDLIGDGEKYQWFRIYCVAWSPTQLDAKERRQGKQMLEESVEIARIHGYGRLEALALRNIGRLLKDVGVSAPCRLSSVRLRHYKEQSRP